ncbi:lipoprotein Rz1 precursor [Serratia phage vB_SspS_OS31]|nr:lipoprotein Rz1 precursor [Serratia phage vB_SspS_OS31]
MVGRLSSFKAITTCRQRPLPPRCFCFNAPTLSVTQRASTALILTWPPRGKKLNTGQSSKISLRAIWLCLPLLLVGCSTTRTAYVPAQCQPIPATLTQPVLAPLPPAR